MNLSGFTYKMIIMNEKLSIGYNVDTTKYELNDENLKVVLYASESPLNLIEYAKEYYPNNDFIYNLCLYFYEKYGF